VQKTLMLVVSSLFFTFMGCAGGGPVDDSTADSRDATISRLSQEVLSHHAGQQGQDSNASAPERTSSGKPAGDAPELKSICWSDGA
jgi:hypothetical protein